MMQVNDDLDLLDLMLQDRMHSSDLYKPHVRWLNYEKRLLPELRSLGLTDFRRRKNSALFSFGASDLLPRSLRTDAPILKVIKSSMKVKKVEKLWTIASKLLSALTLKI